jgi:hypothetical protein
VTKHLNYGRTDFKQFIGCSNRIRLQEFNTVIGFVVLRVKQLRFKWYTL